MTVSEANLREWTSQAQNTLHKAQSLCTNAEASLQSMTHHLTAELPDLFGNVARTLDSVRRQHEGLGKVIDTIKGNINKMLEDSEKKRTSIEPVIKQFDRVLRQLSNTEVPPFLLATPETPDSHKTLKDFISIDSIDRVRAEIEMEGTKSSELSQLIKQKYLEEIQEPYKSASRNYSKLMKQFEAITPLQLDIMALGGAAPFERHNLIGTILKENASLENELVSILEMLTNHYDQCTKGVQAFHTGISEEFLQVLKNDSLELPDVLRELNTVCEIVHNNEDRANKLLNSNLPLLDQLQAHSREQLLLYRSIRSTKIPKIMLLSDACKSIDTSPKHIETISQLTYHYTQFLRVYSTQYLSELHYQKYVYPRKFLGKLTDFLNDGLHQMQSEEEQRRKNWLVKYGEFIPKELSLPGEQGQPTIVEIITEGLEEIQKESDSEEQGLISVMKQMNVSEAAS